MGAKESLIIVALTLWGLGTGLLLFENSIYKKRLKHAESEYAEFLKLKHDGVSLGDRVMPGTFSIFTYKRHRLACAALRRD